MFAAAIFTARRQTPPTCPARYALASSSTKHAELMAPSSLFSRTSSDTSPPEQQYDHSFVSSEQAPLSSSTSPPSPPSSPQPGVPSWKSPFSFLRDGTTSLRDGTSTLFGNKHHPSMLPPQKSAGGILSSHPEHSTILNDATAIDVPPTAEKETPKSHFFPPWATWKDWKKISLDLYIRLVDRPQDTRVRLKQTIALLPIAKLKPVIDFAHRGPNLPPIAMHLDIKLLDCLKYRIRPDGTSSIQVRAKAPLSDPRFLLDVVYERDLQTALESVKISFRVLQVACLKAPGFGAGLKFPIRFDNGIKSTIRVKKYLAINPQPDENDQRRRPLLIRKGGAVAESSRGRRRMPSAQSRDQARPRFKVFGPTGIDLKFRCLEYR